MTHTKDCQETCILKATPEAVFTIFMTDNRDRRQDIDAITGALHACYPGIPQKMVRKVVDEVRVVLEKAQAEAYSRLYLRKIPLLHLMTSKPAISLYGLAAMVALATFFLGLRMGRRAKGADFSD